MPLHAVAEDLVKKDAGGASGKNRRTDEWFHGWGAQKAGEIDSYPLHGGFNRFRTWQPVEIGALKILVGAQIHSIRGFPSGGNGNIGEGTPVQQPRPLGADQIFCLSLDGQDDVRIQNSAGVGKLGGPLAQKAGPLLVRKMGPGRRLLMDGGRFDGEIVRIVFLFQLGLRVGFDLNQAPSGQPVSAVSLDPDLLTDGIRYVVERYDGAGCKSGPLAVHDMIIVELRITHADSDVEIAEVCGVVAGECAEAGSGRVV